MLHNYYLKFLLSLSRMFIPFHYESRLLVCYCTIVHHPLLAFFGGFTGGHPFFGKRFTYYLFGRLA